MDQASRDAHAVMERAHKKSIRVPVDEQAAFVQDVVGSRLAAAALGLKDTRTLSSWAGGGPIRGADAQHRLQVLFRVVAALEEAFSPAVAAAFLRARLRWWCSPTSPRCALSPACSKQLRRS